MEPAGLEPATSRSQVDNPPPSARETRTRSGEGISALPAELRPPACRAVLRVGGAAERSALAPGVACPRASGSAPAGHPCQPPGCSVRIVVRHLLVSWLARKRKSPHPACARVGRSCRSPVAERVMRSRRKPSRNSHAGCPSLLFALVPWLADATAAASETGRRAELAAASAARAQVRTPPTGARRPRRGRRETCVLPRIAGESVERACLHRCRVVGSGCLMGGTDPPETKNRAADVLPQPWLRGPLRGPWRARDRGGRWNIGTRLP